jgi:hypothetical protein
MTDKPFNAGDESQVKERIQRAKTARENELDDLKLVLDTKPGRRFIWRMLVASELFAVAEVMNASIYALEGRRKLGKLLFNDVMEAKPEAYLLMMKESKE